MARPQRSAGRWRPAAVALLLLGGAGVLGGAPARGDGGPPPAASASQAAAYAAATAADRRGDGPAAAAGFERFAREHPDDPLAAAALARAAQLREERLGEPERALTLYREILRRYPDRRAARRAQARSAYLARALGAGAAPLREYQEILAGFAGRPRAESVRRMEALLARSPRFPLAARAAYWIGAMELRAGHSAAARAAWLRTERDFPGTPWAWRARKARADLLAAEGRWRAAGDLYAELARTADPELRRVAATAAAHARADRWRRWSARGATALAALLLGLLALGAGIRREPRRLLAVSPAVWVYLAAGGLLTVLAWRAHPPLGRAFLEITLATAFGLHLAGHGVRRLRAAAGPTGRPLRRGLLLLAAVALLVVSAGYGAVFRTGLLSAVAETVANGPEQ